MNEALPIKNVRPVVMLFADAPGSFSEIAEEAQLAFVEKATEAGTRYVIDFNDLADARPDHPLIRQLNAISAEPANDSFWQICLEACGVVPRARVGKENGKKERTTVSMRGGRRAP